MKKKVSTGMLAAALFGAVAVGSANAGVVFDPTGSGNFDTDPISPTFNPAAIEVVEIDWVSNTALAQDVAFPLVVGSTFDTFAHSRASVFNGGATPIPDLAPDIGGVVKSELTFVTGFQSRVTQSFGVPGVAGTAFFELAGPTLKNGTPNFFEIYWDAPGNPINPVSNDFDPQDITGSPEFRNGVLIYRGSVVHELSIFNSIFAALAPLGPNDADAIDSPLNGVPTALGTGSIFDITADIDFIDSNFLQITNLPGFINLLITDGNLRDPFLQAEVSTQVFNGVADVAVVPAAVNGLTPGDFLFEHDSATTFVEALDVPEPATAALGLMGLAGLVFGSRRRKA